MVKKSNQVEQDLIEPPKYTHSHTHRRITHSLVPCWTNQAEIWHVTMNVITPPPMFVVMGVVGPTNVSVKV